MILSIVGKSRPYAEIGNNEVASFVERRRAIGKLLKTRNGKVRRIGEVSDSTVGKALAVWQAVHTMARDLWELPVKPIAWSKHTPAEPDPRVTSIPPAKAKELLLALPENIQLAAWFALATGCRQGQIAQLTHDRVDLERRTIRVQRQKRKAKGTSWEVKHLNDMAVTVLLRTPRNTRAPELVFDFTNFRKHWDVARVAVGLPEFRFHDLRHVFATWLGENGASLQAVSKALGHSSISVTMKYLEVFDSHVRDAVHMLPALPGLVDSSGPRAPRTHRR